METKHTAGPWTYSEAGHKVYAADGDTVLAKVTPSERQHVDGPLLAAAPDLLAACRAVVQWASEPGEHGGNPWCKQFVKLADAAIAKAEVK